MMIETLVQINHLKDFQEQGFFSRSYIATDDRLSRTVAVKDVNTDLSSANEDFEQYFAEALKLSIASHPRILPVYYVGFCNSETQGKQTPRIVTKYLENGSLNGYLESLLAEDRTIDLDRGIRYAHQIIQGMIHLHSLDILHLDLKASNVLIGDDNKVVLADFGQSKFLDDTLIVKKNDFYPVLNPPENIKGRVIDKTADIYQFGILLYSIFNYDKYIDALRNKYKVDTDVLKDIFQKQGGKEGEQFKEFKQNMRKLAKDIKSGSFPNRDDFHNYIPNNLKKVINKCLSVEIDRRFNDFYEIQAELNKLVFPKHVGQMYLDLNEGRVFFNKSGNKCSIGVVENNKDFSLFPMKNDRNKPSKNVKNISSARLSKALLDLINDL